MAGVGDKGLLIFCIADLALDNSAGNQTHYDTAEQNAGADQYEGEIEQTAGCGDIVRAVQDHDDGGAVVPLTVLIIIVAKAADRFSAVSGDARKLHSLTAVYGRDMAGLDLLRAAVRVKNDGKISGGIGEFRGGVMGADGKELLQGLGKLFIEAAA